MTSRNLFLSLILLPGGILLGGEAKAQTTEIQLRFSGTFNTNGNTIFELNGSAIPFQFEVSYDPGLAPAPTRITAGEAVDEPFVAGSDFYGYDRTGITESSFQFGSGLWTTDDLQLWEVGAYQAHLWFDLPLESGLPTGFAFRLVNMENEILTVGGDDYQINGPLFQRFLSSHEAEISDDGKGYLANSHNLTVAVPEPKAGGLAGLIVLGLFNRFRKKRG